MNIVFPKSETEYLIIFDTIIIFFAFIKKFKINLHSDFDKKDFTIKFLLITFFQSISTFHLYYLIIKNDLSSYKDIVFLSMLTSNFSAFKSYIIAPILEELFFRGYLLNIGTKTNFYTRNIFQALVFSSIHVFNYGYGAYLYLFFTFILGLITGFIYKKYGLISSILLHSFVNLFGNIIANSILYAVQELF